MDTITNNGEECFIIYLFHLMQGMAFTTIARDYFGGDPQKMSEMFETMVNYIYFTFYNKISGTSLDQRLPSHSDTCRHLIHRSLSNDAIYETTMENGEIINSRMIRHQFDFEVFRIFEFIDDFAMRTARPGARPLEPMTFDKTSSIFLFGLHPGALFESASCLPSHWHYRICVY